MNRILTRRSILIGSAATLLLPTSVGAIPKPSAVAKRIEELERTAGKRAAGQLRYKVHVDVATMTYATEATEWYRKEFRPRRPRPMTFTDTFGDDNWTSELTGQTYSQMYGFRYVQEFGDGSEEEDEFWLVHEGEHGLGWIPGKMRPWAWESHTSTSRD